MCKAQSSQKCEFLEKENAPKIYTSTAKEHKHNKSSATYTL